MIDGVWVVYDYNVGPYLISAWPSELDALREMNERGYGHVGFLRYGVGLAGIVTKSDLEQLERYK